MAKKLIIPEMRETKRMALRCEIIDGIVQQLETQLSDYKSDYNERYETVNAEYARLIDEEGQDEQTAMASLSWDYSYIRVHECKARIEILEKLISEVTKLCTGK